jgi:tRNA nucleotidyltransferase/poly(A) polymerase
MKRLVIAFGLSCAALMPASAQTPVEPGDNIVVAESLLGVTDPHAFVAATYARYQANPNVPPANISASYSPRLRALFDAYDAWQRQHEDEVGALDFDWWTNAQDYQIRNLTYRVIDEGPDLRWIAARFDNGDRHEEIRFRFVRQSGRWYLDDAMQGTGSGDDGWTLSALLQRREE